MYECPGRIHNASELWRGTANVSEVPNADRIKNPNVEILELKVMQP